VDLMIGKVLGVIVTVVVLGAIIGGASGLWDTMMDSDTSVQAITDATAPTTIFQTLWPIMLLVIGVGIAAGVIMYAVKEFGF
jgi:membrane protein insertase Oxa1/YidC/SpoIIIJ